MGMRRARAFPGRTWSWIRGHWLDLAIPPLTFLIVAGITIHFLWVRQGRRLDDARSHFRAASSAGQQGDHEVALREIDSAAKSAPDDARFHSELATAYQNLQQPERALEHQEKSLRLSPPSEAGFISFVSTLCDRGRFDEAERILRQDVGKRWPNSADAAYYEAIIHFYRDKGPGGLTEAISCLERCLRLNPKHANALYQYGVCLSRVGRLPEAERAFKAVIPVNPVHRATYHELSRVLRGQGKDAEAKRTLGRFQVLDTAQRRVAYLKTQAAIKQGTVKDLLVLGELYLTLNQPQQAEHALAQYLRSEPTDTVALTRLSEAYRRQNRPQDAAAMTKLAAALESRQRPPR